MSNSNRATREDLFNSVEQDGTVTDHLKVYASKLFGVDYDKVTPDQWNHAKASLHASPYRPGKAFNQERYRK